MERTQALLAARAALADGTDRLAGLLAAHPNLTVPLRGTSPWTVRDAAVHLVVCANVHADIAAGAPSPVGSLAADRVAAHYDQVAADIPEADPARLAGLVRDAVSRYQRVVTGRPGGQPTSYHGGVYLDLADLTAVLAAEVLLHGHDIARALGEGWPVEPEAARLVLGAWTNLLADPAAVVLALARREPCAGLPRLYTRQF